MQKQNDEPQAAAVAEVKWSGYERVMAASHSLNKLGRYLVGRWLQYER